MSRARRLGIAATATTAAVALLLGAAGAQAADQRTFRDARGDVKVVDRSATAAMRKSVDLRAVTLSSTESTALLRLRLVDITAPRPRTSVKVGFTFRSPKGRTTFRGRILDGTTTGHLVTAAGQKRRAVLTWGEDSDEVVVSTARRNFPTGRLTVRATTKYATRDGVTVRDARGGMAIALR